MPDFDPRNYGYKKLSLLVKSLSKIVEIEERPYLRLRLSDNGAGYSSEVLKKLSEPDEQFEQYHIGISNLRRRMALIYQNDYQIAFFNAPNGGACSLIYLPMQTEQRREEDERTDR